MVIQKNKKPLISTMEYGNISVIQLKNVMVSGRANFFRGQGATGLSGHLRRVISLQEGRRF